MEQSKLCKSQEKFVRIVTASPESMSVLATDQQLHDLVRFATKPSKHCIVSIDSFYEWFSQYHGEEIVKTMLKPVRESVGLGDPLTEFNRNDSESTNSSVKQFLGFKKNATGLCSMRKLRSLSTCSRRKWISRCSTLASMYSNLSTSILL